MFEFLTTGLIITTTLITKVQGDLSFTDEPVHKEYDFSSEYLSFLMSSGDEILSLKAIEFEQKEAENALASQHSAKNVSGGNAQAKGGKSKLKQNGKQNSSTSSAEVSNTKAKGNQSDKTKADGKLKSDVNGSSDKGGAEVVTNVTASEEPLQPDSERRIAAVSPTEVKNSKAKGSKRDKAKANGKPKSVTNRSSDKSEAEVVKSVTATDKTSQTDGTKTNEAQRPLKAKLDQQINPKPEEPVSIPAVNQSSDKPTNKVYDRKVRSNKSATSKPESSTKVPEKELVTGNGVDSGAKSNQPIMNVENQLTNEGTKPSNQDSGWTIVKPEVKSLPTCPPGFTPKKGFSGKPTKSHHTPSNSSARHKEITVTDNGPTLALNAQRPTTRHYETKDSKKARTSRETYAYKSPSSGLHGATPTTTVNQPENDDKRPTKPDTSTNVTRLPPAPQTPVAYKPAVDKTQSWVNVLTGTRESKSTMTSPLSNQAQNDYPSLSPINQDTRSVHSLSAKSPAFGSPMHVSSSTPLTPAQNNNQAESTAPLNLSVHKFCPSSQRQQIQGLLEHIAKNLNDSKKANVSFVFEFTPTDEKFRRIGLVSSLIKSYNISCADKDKIEICTIRNESANILTDHKFNCVYILSEHGLTSMCIEDIPISTITNHILSGYKMKPATKIMAEESVNPPTSSQKGLTFTCAKNEYGHHLILTFSSDNAFFDHEDAQNRAKSNLGDHSYDGKVVLGPNENALLAKNTLISNFRRVYKFTPGQFDSFEIRQHEGKYGPLDMQHLSSDKKLDELQVVQKMAEDANSVLLPYNPGVASANNEDQYQQIYENQYKLSVVFCSYNFEDKLKKKNEDKDQGQIVNLVTPVITAYSDGQVFQHFFGQLHRLTALSEEETQNALRNTPESIKERLRRLHQIVSLYLTPSVSTLHIKNGTTLAEQLIELNEKPDITDLRHSVDYFRHFNNKMCIPENLDIDFTAAEIGVPCSGTYINQIIWNKIYGLITSHKQSPSVISSMIENNDESVNTYIKEAVNIKIKNDKVPTALIIETDPNTYFALAKGGCFHNTDLLLSSEANCFANLIGWKKCNDGYIEFDVEAYDEYYSISYIPTVKEKYIDPSAIVMNNISCHIKSENITLKIWYRYDVRASTTKEIITTDEYAIQLVHRLPETPQTVYQNNQKLPMQQQFMSEPSDFENIYIVYKGYKPTDETWENLKIKTTRQSLVIPHNSFRSFMAERCGVFVTPFANVKTENGFFATKHFGIYNSTKKQFYYSIPMTNRCNSPKCNDFIYETLVFQFFSDKPEYYIINGTKYEAGDSALTKEQEKPKLKIDVNEQSRPPLMEQV